MTPENTLVVCCYFTAGAVALWLHRMNIKAKLKPVVTYLTGEVLPPLLPRARGSEIHPRCNAVEAAADPLGAKRPPDAHQACASASAATGGGMVQATPTGIPSPESLRTASAYVQTHAAKLEMADRLALIASVGGLGCVRAFYEKGL